MQTAAEKRLREQRDDLQRQLEKSLRKTKTVAAHAINGGASSASLLDESGSALDLATAAILPPKKRRNLDEEILEIVQQR